MEGLRGEDGGSREYTRKGDGGKCSGNRVEGRGRETDLGRDAVGRKGCRVVWVVGVEWCIQEGVLAEVEIGM